MPEFDPLDYVISSIQAADMVKKYEETLGEPDNTNITTKFITYPIELLGEIVKNYDDPDVTHFRVNFSVKEILIDGNFVKKIYVFFSPAGSDGEGGLITIEKSTLNLYNRGDCCPPSCN